MSLNTQSAALNGRPFKPPRLEGGKVSPRFQAGSLNPDKGFFTATNLTREVKRQPAEEYHRNSRVYPQSMIEVTRSTLAAPNNDRYSRLSLPDGYGQGSLHLNYYSIDSTRPEYFGNTTTILQRASSSYHHPSIPSSENATSSHFSEGQTSGMFTDRTPSMFGETFKSPPYGPIAGNSSPRDTRTSSQPLHQYYYAGVHDAETLKQEEISVEHPKQYPNFGGDGEQTFRQTNNGALQQQQHTSRWNNGKLGDPILESQRSFPINGHQLPSHDSKFPRMRKHYSISRSNSEEYAYEYGTASSNLNTEGRLKLGRTQSYPPRNAELTSAQYQSTALRFPEEKQQYFDLVNGIRSLGTYENEGDTGYVPGNDDLQRKVLNTTSKGNPTSSTCSSPGSFDDEASTRRRSFAQLTGSNLRTSEQRYEEEGWLDDMKAFECQVDVWSFDPRVYRGPKAGCVTLLFDTQCQRSNWVAPHIVKDLRVNPVRLARDEEFVASNGQTMKASSKITLWFGNSQGGSSRRVECAHFLVSPVEEVPYDMLLGASDCLRLQIIQRPRFLALAAAKMSPKKQKDLEDRMDEQKRKVEKREWQISQWRNTNPERQP